MDTSLEKNITGVLIDSADPELTVYWEALALLSNAKEALEAFTGMHFWQLGFLDSKDRLKVSIVRDNSNYYSTTITTLLKDGSELVIQKINYYNGPTTLKLEFSIQLAKGFNCPKLHTLRIDVLTVSQEWHGNTMVGQKVIAYHFDNRPIIPASSRLVQAFSYSNLDDSFTNAYH